MTELYDIADVVALERERVRIGKLSWQQVENVVVFRTSTKKVLRIYTADEWVRHD